MIQRTQFCLFLVTIQDPRGIRACPTVSRFAYAYLWAVPCAYPMHPPDHRQSNTPTLVDNERSRISHTSKSPSCVYTRCRVVNYGIREIIFSRISMRGYTSRPQRETNAKKRRMGMRERENNTHESLVGIPPPSPIRRPNEQVHEVRIVHERTRVLHVLHQRPRQS